MNREIGELFEVTSRDGSKEKLLVYPSDGCEGCYFHRKFSTKCSNQDLCLKGGLENVVGSCSRDCRKDGSQVIFRRIK